MDDILLNKALVIERCLGRIAEEYKNEEVFKANITAQDSVILNLQRACEASIDMGNRIVRLYKYDIPQSARDVFSILNKHKVISVEVTTQMQKMGGLRNIAVHDYQALNIDIVIAVIVKHLEDFTSYAKSVMHFYQENAPKR